MEEYAGSSGRLTRVAVAAAISAVVAAGVAAAGGGGYISAAFGKPKPPPVADQYRPGWGCGDKNHVHTGPPGRQYAPAPPGCHKP